MKWQMRKSIRPITLRRIIETTSVALEEEKITENSLAEKLNISERRARSILRELTRMKLLATEGDYYRPTENARYTIDSYKREDWKMIHDVLFEHYDFYNIFINELSGPTQTKEDLLRKLSRRQDLAFNETALDILCDWAERLGQVQRNLYNNRYYLLQECEVSHNTFVEATEQCYNALNLQDRPGIKLVYIEIARLREAVCEKLRVRRDLFDTTLEWLFLNNIGKMELSGAPLITSAKESPTSLKMFEKGGKETILSPKYKTIREGKGLELGGKLYHYIAIFEKLEE